MKMICGISNESYVQLQACPGPGALELSRDLASGEIRDTKAHFSSSSSLSGRPTLRQPAFLSSNFNVTLLISLRLLVHIH
jgi:hypothetical protein